jgi:NADH:ubiquinone oxidoreductase subunit F (NADH-binding)
MSSASAVTEAPDPHGGQLPGTLPRLLAGITPEGAMGLEQHLSVHGPVPELTGGRRDREEGLRMIEEVERAGLLGHGGAAFPAGRKMRAVAGARGRAIVVANGAEGEPASHKDRTLMAALPHLVLDGATLAAAAVGADEVIVCVCASAQSSLEAMRRAIEERAPAPRARRSPSVRLAEVPGGYVAGEESALVKQLAGGLPTPTFRPPMPYEQGLRRRPTLILNVETLAHIALIARHGAAWFRRLGTAAQPGSALVTLSGPVAHPGVYEIEHGASLSSLIEAGGGATAPIRGVLLGGYGGSWLGAERLGGVALSNEHLATHGASLGAGVVLLLSEAACPVAETARVSRWLAGESAGQCGPCVHGLDSLATTVEQLVAGSAPAKAGERIERIAALVRRRGACGHPDGAVNFLLSALESFAPDFADHARHGACERCARPSELPLPGRGHAVTVPTTGEPRR